MGKDPYKYFRIEARELLEGLSQGILQIDRGDVAPDVVTRLLRLAHTLKGAARVVRQPAIAELAHAAEDILVRHRESGEPLSRQHVGELLGLVDRITALVDALDVAGDEVKAPRRAGADEPIETMRVDVHEMDAMLRSVTEARARLAALRSTIDGMHDLREGATLRAEIDRVESELTEIHGAAHRLRLIPAHTIFPSLDRAAYDAAQALDVRVEVVSVGGDIRLDASVLMSLRDALMHVVRNAVSHGIEAPSERQAAGKASAGRVQLNIERRGSRVAFVCHDDGRGIDLEAVRRAAVARGLVTADDARSLTDDRVIELLYGGGLTTSARVTELSGRGIGLDVVRATTARLKGTMSIRSRAGRGTTVEIHVPISIAGLPGLVVEAGGARAAIPLDAVRRALRENAGELVRSADGDAIVVDGAAIPFLRLDRALRRDAPNDRRSWSVLVIEYENRKAAVAVDRLLDPADMVVHPLPEAIDADPIVAGAFLDGEGRPILVLSPEGLVASAGTGRAEIVDAAPPARAPILVVDDSLTTRMLEQSILESAGYEVELAVSAEDALAKARARRYSLFIVDVEMPGMSGVEFVAETRADATLREIPAILVTSRGAPEDRKRGEQAGARGYIVKSEFDQRKLLQTIRALIA
jgi:two-component system chemotaxis sensor kinase CheA